MQRSLNRITALAIVLTCTTCTTGFPEPFLGGNATEARRWSLGYRDRLIREEVTSLESISDLGRLEQLAIALPARVGSPLSIHALREDLQVAHATLARWLDVLERLYAIFRIAPFGAPLLRAVKKLPTPLLHFSPHLPVYQQRLIL